MSAVLSAVLPVFMVAGLGFLVRKAFPLDARTLATINIYLLIPSLVFDGLYNQDLHWGLFARCAVAVVVFTGAMVGLAVLVNALRRGTQEENSAMLMTVFPNLGNFGIPVVTFAFGEAQGLPLALIFLVCGSLMQNTLAVYFAQRSRHGVWHASTRVFHFPMIYAFALALFAQRFDLQLPGPLVWAGEILLRAVALTADAAIPLQLILLGSQIAATRLKAGPDVALACAMRLVISPAVALGIGLILGLGPLPLKVFILQFSGPVAVGMAVYGVQFSVRPDFLASVVAWSFVLSLFTVSGLLLILYAW